MLPSTIYNGVTGGCCTLSKISFKRVWKDREDGELQIEEDPIKLSNIIHETDEIALGGDFMIFVDEEYVYCSIEEFNDQEQS